MKKQSNVILWVAAIFMWLTIIFLVLSSCKKDDDINKQPVAVLEVSDIVINPGECITFDASKSYDDDAIKEYRWKFTQENSNWSLITYKAVVDHCYDDSGHYTVILEVADKEGWSDMTSITISVREFCK